MSQCSAVLDARHIDALATELDACLEARSAPQHQAVRLELICRVRKLIESGQYDTDARLQVALDRLLDEMM